MAVSVGFLLRAAVISHSIVGKAIETFGVDEEGRLNDQIFRAKLVKAQIDDVAFSATVDRLNAEMKVR